MASTNWTRQVASDSHAIFFADISISDRSVDILGATLLIAFRVNLILFILHWRPKSMRASLASLVSSAFSGAHISFDELIPSVQFHM